MKITTKTTKQELKNFLGANAQAVKTADKDLFDRLNYASEMSKKDDSKVQRKDLVDLAKEVIKVLGDKVVEPKTETEPKAEQPKAENSTKKLAKGKKKVEEPTAEPTAKVEEPKAEEPKAKVEKKKVTKKDKAPKKEVVEEKTPMFPETLEVEETKYELAHDIKTMEDLYNAVVTEGEEIVFAYWWTKDELRKYDYFDGLVPQPKQFKDNLDICTTVYVSEEKKIAYNLSRYTEAFYSVIDEYLLEEDGYRVARGAEFQVYRAIK